MIVLPVAMHEWLYPDRLPENALQSVRLKTAQGGSCGFQLRLSALPRGTLRVCFTAAAPMTAEIFQELPVRVQQNTGVHGFTTDWDTAKDYATRPAPFSVYDALLPLSDEGVSVDGNAALYIALRAETAMEPGVSAARLTLTLSDEEAKVPFTVEIAPAALPAESLSITNWFSLKNMADAHGVKPWSEDHWRMIERYGRMMRRMHQNVFWLTADTVIATRGADGGYEFDFSRRERLIRLYLAMGFETIEGAPLYHRTSWDSCEFLITVPEGDVPALSPEGYDYAVAYLRAWNAFLRKNGWYERAIQHVGDEPHERCGNEYRILSGIVRKMLPGMKLIDAIETHELRGAVDIWVPKNDYYATHQAEMETLRRQGDDIWYYTCCIPGGHYCNRLLDFPLLRTRMLFWGNYRYGLTGYLHWGLNHWRGDPFTDTCPANGPVNFLPAGDTNIVYPMGERVLSSMRAEVSRCGAEDYELLRALAERNRPAADAICRAVFRAFDDCDNAPEAFEDAHSRLLDALAQ